MNREELDWLLQTTKDAEAAERFVFAQYERGRISFQMMADVAREWGWINRTANHSCLYAHRCMQIDECDALLLHYNS